MKNFIIERFKKKGNVFLDNFYEYYNNDIYVYFKQLIRKIYMAK